MWTSCRQLLVIALLAALAPWAQAQSGDLKPSDVFMQAFMLLREVRRLESKQDFQAAAAKCREASEMYDAITRRWPAWETDMVDTRRKKVRRDYERLAKRAKEMALPEMATNADPTLPQRNVGSPKVSTARSRPNGIASVPREATVNQRFQQLKTEVERLRADRARLLRLSQDQVDNTAAANRALGKEREKVNQLEAKLAEAQDELTRLQGKGVEALTNQVDELKAQLEQATKSLEEQNGQTDKILAEYEASNLKIQEMSLQIDELTAQRDEMAALIKGLQTGESSLELVVENTRLREQLNATQARVDELELDKLENEAEIERLREEVSVLRLELAQVKQENEAYKQQLLELQGSLDDTERELTFNPPAVDNTAAQRENEVLREVIQRQLQQQAFRQQKRELIIAELQNMESGSDDLVAQIDALAAEMPLSEEEQAAVQGQAPASNVSSKAQVSASAPSVGLESVDRKLVRFAEAAAYNFEQERYESAATYYEDILSFAPQHVETLCNLGVTRIRQNKVEEACQLFERAILSDSQSGRAHLLHGVSAYHLDDVPQAIESVRKAMEIAPTDPEPATFLGAVYLLREDWAMAIPALQSAIDAQPRHAHAHYNLACAYLWQPHPDYRSAYTHYSEALKHGLPKNAQMEALLSNLIESSATPVNVNAAPEEAPAS